MSAYKLLDFKDLYEAIAAELKLQLSDTTSLNRIKRVVNMVYLDEVAPRARWYWLQGHAVIRHKISYSVGTCAITPNTSTVTISTYPPVTVGDSGSFKGWYFSVDGQNEIYRIASHTAEANTFELETPYNGNLLTATAFKIYQENIPLPTDCRETVEIYYDHQATPLVGKGLQEFRKIQTSAPKTMGRPAYYCTYDFQDPTDETAETESDRYRILKVWPAISQYTTILKVDYIKEVAALELDGDEPLMPVEDRIVLYYGALSILWSSIGRNPEESARNKALYEDKIARMMGKITDSMDKPRVEPESGYIVAKRGPRIGQYSRKGLGPGASGGATYNAPSYLENVSINGATITGNVAVNPGITVDGRDLSADGMALDTHIASIGDVHGALGGIVGLDNAQVLTNKTIDGSNNTITNLVDFSISPTAAITLSKLAAVTANKAMASDALGVLVPSTTTDTELGYLSGVTSNVQTQLTNNATAISDHLSDMVDAHDASAISSVPAGNLAATDVQAALNELQSDIDARALDSSLSSHVTAASDAHDASAISSVPAGNLAATDVQSALNELQSDVDTRALDSTLSSHTSASTGVHGVTGAVVGTTDTQNLSNKTITASDLDGGTASNTSRITLPKAAKTTLDALTRKQGTILFDTTSNKPYYDDGTNLKVIGSGSGGATNFITNGDAETGTTGWATYADAAGTRPVDGTGGTANVTLTTTSTNPLAGTNSFLITKDAANRQGQGASFDFTIDSAYKAKVLKIEMDYIVESGTFAAGSSTTNSDLIVYLYDVTNGVLIEPSSFKLLSNSTTVSDRFSGTFQTPYNSTSYRLIFHVASASTSAWALKVDNISVSPSQYVYGSPITDWQSYTPTITAQSGSLTNYVIDQSRWRRVGDSLEIMGQLRFTGAAGTWLFPRVSIPPGLSLDLQNNTATPNTVRYNDAGNNDYLGTANPAGSNIVQLGGHTGASGAGVTVTQAAPFAFGTGDGIYWNVSGMKILGWSSSVQMSDGYDGRVVAFAGYAANPYSATANTAIPLTVVKDSVAGFSTDTYTVKTAGDYRATMTLGNNTTTAFNMRIKINGTTANYVGTVPGSTSLVGSGSTILPGLKAGDTIQFVTDTTLSVYGSANITFTLEKLSGSPTISASEEVSCKYTTATTTINTTPTTIAYTTKVYDTHGAYNTSTGLFTAPVSGRYEISAHFYGGATSSSSVNNSVSIRVIENGTVTSFISVYTYQVTGVSLSPTGFGSTTVDLLAGQTVGVVVQRDSPVASTNLSGGSTSNHVSIKKVK